MIQIDIPMPTNCILCPCESSQGNYCNAVGRAFSYKEKKDKSMKPSWCPLIEVDRSEEDDLR